MLHNQILRDGMTKFEGYEVSMGLIEGGNGGEGSFCVVFQKPQKALSWCAWVQEQLLGAPWPAGLAEAPGAEEVINKLPFLPLLPLCTN